MKISVIDGALYQWDTGRKIRIIPRAGQSVDFVHYSNGMVAEVSADGSGVIAPIPNILLQTAQNFTVYTVIVSEDGIRTIYDCTLPIRPKKKPDGYVYTETEVMTWEYFNKRLTDLEGEGLANAVAAYLEENPVEAGATAEEAAQIQQNKQDIENLSTGKLDASKLPEAVNDALAQAKASGDFKGEQGEPGKDGQDGSPGKDGYTPVKGVDYFDGEPGKDGEDGQPGADGKDYILTDTDKQEIAEQAAQLVDVPDVEIPTELPNPHALTFTGAVSATYDGSEAVSVEIPTDDHINELINTALGVIENGTY